MSEVEQDLIDKGKEQGAYALEYVFPMEDKHGNTRFTPYMLDLEQNVQINKQSNKNRPFVFFSGSSLANCPLLSPRAPMQWLIYIDEKDVYIRMSKVEQDFIEKGKEEGYQLIQYVWKTEDKHGKTWFTQYELDLEHSMQINKRTGKKRSFAFFGGSS